MMDVLTVCTLSGSGMRLAELYPELLVYSVSRPACVPRSRREDS